jgi:hypothetical protein
LIVENQDVSFDGSQLKPTIFDQKVIEYSLSNPEISEPTDLSIIFNTTIPVESYDTCYVKYTFPDAIDISKMIKDDINAYGLFVNSNGNPTTSILKSNIDEDSTDPKWILI